MSIAPSLRPLLRSAKPASWKPEARAEGMRFGDQKAVSLSLRFGLRSMCTLTDFFADRCERAPSNCAVRASKHVRLDRLFC